MNFNNFLQILAAITAGTKNDMSYDYDDDFDPSTIPCFTEAFDTYMCLDAAGATEDTIEDCLECITEGDDAAENAETCEDVQQSSFCEDIGACVVRECPEDCHEEWATFGKCMATFAETTFGCNPCAEDAIATIA